MGYLVQIGLALLVQAQYEERGVEIAAQFWPLAALALAPHALGWSARRMYLRGRFRFAERLLHLLTWSPLWLHALALHAFGWTEALEQWTGSPVRLMEWPTPQLLLAFAPFVVYGLSSIDARARWLSASRARSGVAFRFQARLFAASLAPLVGYVLVASAVGASDALRLRVETIALWNAAFAAGMLCLFAAGVPWLLRNTWETEPLPAGVEREVLEGVSKLADFRCKQVYVWRTGSTVANAAIIGLFPRQRVVLFSDLLLEQLDLRELASVYAHEIGHAKRNHVVIFAAWAFAALFGADLLALWLAPGDSWVGSGVLVAVMLVWALVFGWMSRRFELEADLYSLRLLGDPQPLARALEQVSGPHGRSKTSWRHFSSDRRIEFLGRAATDPRVGERLERRLGWVARAGIVACLVVLALEGRQLWTSWPRDQVLLSLRQGDYPSAAAGLGRITKVDPELAALVARAQTDPRAGLPELEVAARRALAGGDWKAAAEWLDLGALRGSEAMARVQGVLDAALSEEKPAAAELRLLLPEAWRADFGPLLDQRGSRGPGAGHFPP